MLSLRTPQTGFRYSYAMDGVARPSLGQSRRSQSVTCASNWRAGIQRVDLEPSASPLQGVAAATTRIAVPCQPNASAFDVVLSFSRLI